MCEKQYSTDDATVIFDEIIDSRTAISDQFAIRLLAKRLNEAFEKGRQSHVWVLTKPEPETLDDL